MISCQTFRATMRPGTEDRAVLAHLRSCDACLEHAVAIDSDVFFRSIGGNELVPPGGVDEFVAGVMTRVHQRETEKSMSRPLPLNRYLRAAAAVLLVIATATGVYRFSRHDAPPVTVPAQAAATISKPLATKAVVEAYQSQSATIVEVAGSADTRVVMIYDESLPLDL